MAYKYPIYDVFYQFCKIASFFATEPTVSTFEIFFTHFYYFKIIQIVFKRIFISFWDDLNPSINHFEYNMNIIRYTQFFID